MTHFARATILIAVLAACTPDTRTPAERRVAAARADSSAAGYDVGMHPPARSITDSGLANPRSAMTPGQADSVKRDSLTRLSQVAGSSATPVPASSPVATVPLPGNPPTRPRVLAAVDTGRPSGTPNRLPPLDPAVAATFLKFDETKKTATFQLASGTEIDAPVSFNGARRGERVLTIPIGWQLEIEFINRDPDLPHSATVIPGVEPLPEQLPAAAFAQAHSVKVDEGLLEGDSDQVSFVVSREGRYFIACGVLGHAQRGQWLVLEVSPSVTRPSYR
jgi:sulfocyanin